MSNYKRFTFIFLITIFYLKSDVLCQPVISLDFRECDIRNLIRIIAEVSNQNIIVGDDVEGKVTVRLLNVPLNEALQVILKSRGLEMFRLGNVIIVESAERLRREYEKRWFLKRSEEGLKELETKMIRLKYANAKEMVPIVKQFLSGRGKVLADEKTNILIIRDVPENINIIKGLFR